MKYKTINIHLHQTVQVKIHFLLFYQPSLIVSHILNGPICVYTLINFIHTEGTHMQSDSVARGPQL